MSWNSASPLPLGMTTTHPDDTPSDVASSTTAFSLATSGQRDEGEKDSLCDTCSDTSSVTAKGGTSDTHCTRASSETSKSVYQEETAQDVSGFTVATPGSSREGCSKWVGRVKTRCKLWRVSWTLRRSKELSVTDIEDLIDFVKYVSHPGTWLRE